MIIQNGSWNKQDHTVQMIDTNVIIQQVPTNKIIQMFVTNTWSFQQLLTNIIKWLLTWSFKWLLLKWSF